MLGPVYVSGSGKVQEFTLLQNQISTETNSKKVYLLQPVIEGGSYNYYVVHLCCKNADTEKEKKLYCEKGLPTHYYNDQFDIRV